MLDINLVSPLVVTKFVVPDMIKNWGGKIINICSLMFSMAGVIQF
ncbi:SDR family NAD(P)-dependent oxidoreductase [Mariniflexile sp. HNIBRBA6329]